MTNTALNKTSVQYMMNRSGYDLSQGSVVIVGTDGTPSAIDLPRTDAYTKGIIGVVLDTTGIKNGTVGAVAFGGYVPGIRLTTSAAVGDTFSTSSTNFYATPHSTLTTGDFGQVLNSGSFPPAILWGSPSGGTGGGSGSVAVSLYNYTGMHADLGSVVVLSTLNENAFVTVTDVGYDKSAIGVVTEPGGINYLSRGSVTFSGYVGQINLNTWSVIGSKIRIGSWYFQGAPHIGDFISGDFAVALTASTTPAAVLLGGMPYGYQSSDLSAATGVHEHGLARWSGTTSQTDFVLPDFVDKLTYVSVNSAIVDDISCTLNDDGTVLTIPGLADNYTVQASYIIRSV